MTAPLPALALLMLAIAGAGGAWTHLPAGLLLAALLWLPGRVLAGLLGRQVAEGWGTGRVAVDATLSLAVLTAALLPLYVLHAPISSVPLALSAVMTLLSGLALLEHRDVLRSFLDPPSWRRTSSVESRSPTSAVEIAAFAAAVALLLPVVLANSGGNVDDWWDLAFVKSWLARGHFHFDEPFLGTDRSHPRFLWSVWLSLQAVVLSCTGAEAWRVQAGALAAIVVVLVVSAQTALARALFGERRALAALSTLTVAGWLWGTDAIPFFTRVYQDKHVAAFALAPVLTALVLRAVQARGANSGTDMPAGERVAPFAIAVACAAVAAVSVHSLVYTMAAFASVVAAAAWSGSAFAAWLRTRDARLLGAALLAPVAYPLGQALRLAVAFGDQGISLANADNPVVRAHLALERILFADTAAWIVHPGAVFGSVAAPALLFALLLARRRREPAARVLLALTAVPSALLFVPFLASAAGALWVPWMLYRLGWLVPVPLLLAGGLWSAWHGGRVVRAGSVAAGALVLALVANTAADRLRRDMAEHPGPGAPAPRGYALQVYRFLERDGGGGRVLATSGFGELVPALTGRPVVASTERQTLVFALEEAGAYARLRDRSEFFAPDTPAHRRDEIADRNGARWAVLPRRLVPFTGRERWLRRFGAEVYFAARAADREGAWWSSTPEGAAAGLGAGWSVVLTNEDWLVARREPRDADDVASGTPTRDANDVEGAARDDSVPSWLAVLGAEPSAASPLFEDPLPRTRGVLASAAGYPGGRAEIFPPPQLLTPTPQPMWIGGGEPWEDIPAQAVIRMQLESECRVDALRIVPYLPRQRREVLEIRIGDKLVRRQAVHDVPIDIALDEGGQTPLRRGVLVRIRSMIGNPLALSDVELMGDPASCQGEWTPTPRAVTTIAEPSAAELLELAAISPTSGRALVSLAHRAADEDRDDAAHAMLAEATSRDPSLVAAWIDLGFSEDARKAPDAALAAFSGAVAADSHSAWAHGCLAWARVRRGSPASALWHALRARSLDPWYADSWTLVAYVAHALGADTVAERALDVARRTDRERNWPYLARAEFAMARGRRDEASAVLREYLQHMPLDGEARERLTAIEETQAAGDVQ